MCVDKVHDKTESRGAKEEGSVSQSVYPALVTDIRTEKKKKKEPTKLK